MKGPWVEPPEDFPEMLIKMMQHARRGGVPAGVPFRHMSRKQLDAIVDALTAAAEAVRQSPAASRTDPRGRARLRLIAEDGLYVVPARTLAAQRRRKPKYVEAS